MKLPIVWICKARVWMAFMTFFMYHFYALTLAMGWLLRCLLSNLMVSSSMRLLPSRVTVYHVGNCSSWFPLLGMMLLRTCGCLYLSCLMLRSCCQLTVGSMGFDRLATTWGALDLTLSDTAAVQGAQSTLGLLGLITPLWLSVF